MALSHEHVRSKISAKKQNLYLQQSQIVHFAMRYPVCIIIHNKFYGNGNSSTLIFLSLGEAAI